MSTSRVGLKRSYLEMQRAPAAKDLDNDELSQIKENSRTINIEDAVGSEDGVEF